MMKRYIPYLRIVISAIYLFSAVNKIYFYDIFSNGVRSTGIFPSAVLPFLIPAVIVVELLFGLAIFMLESKLWLRLSSWVICLPMVLYNLYLILFMNTTKCNCMISFDGKSLSNSFISIALLLFTLGGIYLISKINNGPVFKDISNSLIAVLCIVLAFIGLNLLMRNHYLSDEYNILSSAPYQLLVNNPVEGEVVEFFLALDGSGPEYFIHFMNNALEGTGKFPVYYVINKYGKDDEFQKDELQKVADSKSNIYYLDYITSKTTQLSENNTWIYENNKRVYIFNSQYVFGKLFNEMLVALSVNTRPMKEEMELLKELTLEKVEQSDSNIHVFMLMDRFCSPCDGKFLAAVKGITKELQEKYLTSYNTVYFLNTKIDNDLDTIKYQREKLFSLNLKSFYLGMSILIFDEISQEVRLVQFDPEYIENSEENIRALIEEVASSREIPTRG